MAKGMDGVAGDFSGGGLASSASRKARYGFAFSFYQCTNTTADQHQQKRTSAIATVQISILNGSTLVALPFRVISTESKVDRPLGTVCVSR